MSNVNVQVFPGPSTTQYQITGKIPDVQVKVQEIFDDYPSIAYGTTLVSDEGIPFTDVIVAVVKRSNSCD
jgi:hypothetical protein